MSIIGSAPGLAWSGAAAPSSAKLEAARKRRRVGAKTSLCVASTFRWKAAAVGQIRTLHASFRLKPEATITVDKKSEATIAVDKKSKATTDRFTGSFIVAENNT